MGRRSGVTNEKNEKRSGALMPIVGLTLAIAVGVIAYFLTPMLVDFGVEQNETFAERIEGSEQEFTLGATVVVWLIVFTLGMLLVSIAIGSDPRKEDYVLHPREGDAKGYKKYQKHLEKQKAKRDKLMKQKMERERRNQKGKR